MEVKSGAFWEIISRCLSTYFHNYMKFNHTQKVIMLTITSRSIVVSVKKFTFIPLFASHPTMHIAWFQPACRKHKAGGGLGKSVYWALPSD